MSAAADGFVVKVCTALGELEMLFVTSSAVALQKSVVLDGRSTVGIESCFVDTLDVGSAREERVESGRRGTSNL